MPMYNRYIPQSDGSYRRNRIQDQAPAPAPKPEEPPAPLPPRPSGQSRSAGSFLKNLLPKEFDTGDLLVVLLLLLMAEHGEEDRNTALLTLALYFFM